MQKHSKKECYEYKVQTLSTVVIIFKTSLKTDFRPKAIMEKGCAGNEQEDNSDGDVDELVMKLKMSHIRECINIHITSLMYLTIIVL